MIDPHTVDNEYLKNKILNEEYTKIYIQKVGKVNARVLQPKEIVTTYFYDEKSQIRTDKQQVQGYDKVLVTKHINSKEYNTIYSAVAFHKAYYKNKDNEYVPVEGHNTAYVVNEHISFINCWQQETTLAPGDILLATDAKLLDFYGIFKYNFDDNYAMTKDPRLGNNFKTRKGPL